MNNIYLPLMFLILICGCTYTSIQLARFVYRIDEQHLYITWYMFGVLPFSKKILLSEIVDMKTITSFWDIRPFLQMNNYPQIWGKPFKPKLLLKLQHRFFNILVITPDDVDKFMREIRIRVGSGIKFDKYA